MDPQEFAWLASVLVALALKETKFTQQRIVNLVNERGEELAQAFSGLAGEFSQEGLALVEADSNKKVQHLCQIMDLSICALEEEVPPIVLLHLGMDMIEVILLRGGIAPYQLLELSRSKHLLIQVFLELGEGKESGVQCAGAVAVAQEDENKTLTLF